MEYISKPKTVPIISFMWSFQNFGNLARQPVFVIFLLVGIFSFILGKFNVFYEKKTVLFFVSLQGEVLLAFLPLIRNLISFQDNYIIDFAISFTINFWILWSIGIVILLMCLILLFLSYSEEKTVENQSLHTVFVFHLLFTGSCFSIMFLTSYREATLYFIMFVCFMVFLSKIYTESYKLSMVIFHFVFNSYFIVSWSFYPATMGSLQSYSSNILTTPFFSFALTFIAGLAISMIIGNVYFRNAERKRNEIQGKTN